MTSRVASRLDTTTIDAAPGDVASARVVLSSSASADDDGGASPTTVTLTAIGLDDVGTDPMAAGGALRSTVGGSTRPRLTVVVEPGAEVICDVPIEVPSTVAAGRHAVAIEVSMPGEASRLHELVLAVASVKRVEMVATPSPIRGRRRAKFHLDVINNEPFPVDFEVTGESRDVTVALERSRFQLAAGERATTKAKTRGPRLWRGEPLQHNLLFTARAAASTSTATAPFVQRPVFVRGARAALAAVMVVALWAAALGGVLWWLSQRGDDAEFAFGGELVGVDTDGDGVADTFYNAAGEQTTTPDGIDTDGDGVDDAFVDSNGERIETLTAVDSDGDGVADVFLDETGRAVADPSTGADGSKPPDELASSIDPGDLDDDGVLASGDDSAVGAESVDLPVDTTVAGTVSAPGSNDLSGLSVTLSPVGGAAAPTPTPNGTEARATKHWPIRTVRSFDGEGSVRQSETVAPIVVAPDVNGVFKFEKVQLRRSYELSIAGAGYDTQSRLITPPDDGRPLDLDIEMVPAVGAIRGRVVGGGGVLGGADIIVSDGRISFTTTADTEGDPGSFRIEGLSTPGVYTMTTTLDGYATDVRQIELGPGEQANGVEVRLSRGVATITGRITDTSGRALPGADILGTNGVDQRSTTSFTAGDLGSYSLPQLTIGTDYTITVSLDGYGVQTRRVAVNGSVAGVNIVLAPTSSTISGTVTSSGGGEIVGAGVILQSGDLEFRTSTAATPAGSFEVADLPPGSYTVTIEHFEHETSTQFVDVIAGSNPAPLTVTLQELDGVPSAGSGELVVEVVDPNAETAEERQISGATVRLTRTRTGEVEREVTQDEFDFRLLDIPVGTYTLVAEAPGYAPSAPRQVSIGLQAERREVTLEQLGAARGRVIDALTKQPIQGGYALELFIVIGGQTIPTNRTLLGDAVTGEWETEPKVLPPGEYLIVPSGPPLGYQILSDQPLDAEANGLMRFVLEGNFDEPKQVGDIEADPYPDVRGRVLTPRLAGAVTELDPIDDNSLEAVLRCDGVTAELKAELFDNAGQQSATTPLYDEFFFDFREVARNELVGDCRVDVTADTYVDGSISLASLVPSDGFKDPDRTANIALRAGVDSFGGQVYWTDPRGSVQVPLDGVAFSTRAITRIDPASGSGALPGTNPDPVLTDLSSTSDAGAWGLDGQVFGTATYDIAADGFDPTSFDVTIDESRNRTVVAPGDIRLTPPSPATAGLDSGTSFDIDLLEPNRGEVQGRVEILTFTNPDYAALTLSAVAPDGTPVVGGDITGPSTTDGTFSIPSAAAGTWDVDVAIPDNHILHSNGSSTRMTEVVDPGETEGRFTTTLVDLGTVTVDLNKTNGDPITTEATIDLVPIGGDAVRQTITSTASPTGVHVFERVVVDVDEPTTVPATYRLVIRVPGYDPTTAVITAPEATTVAGMSNIVLPMRAGVDATVDLRIDEYGSLVGEIVGVSGAATTALAVGPDGDAQVTVRSAGSSTPNPDALVRPLEGGAPGQFEVVAPPGTYELDVSHPSYVSPPFQIAVDNSGVFGVPSGQYVIANNRTNTLTNDFRLNIRTVALQVDAFEQLGGTAVGDFTVTITGGTSTVALVSTVNGTATVIGLVPDTYRVTVRSYDSGGVAGGRQDRFPFIADVTVRPSESEGVDTTTQLAAVMPLVSPGIDVEVVAWNSNDQPVVLPVVDVTRTYTTVVNGEVADDQGGPTGTLPGITTAEATEVATTDATTPVAPQTVEFRELVAFGVHRITFGTVDGYTPPAAFDVVVGAPDLTQVKVVPGTAVYRVADVNPSLTVSVPAPYRNDADFVDLSARLVTVNPPVGAPTDYVGTVTASSVGSRTFQFAGVPPGVDYGLELLDSLYQPTAPTALPSVFVPIDTSTAQTGAVTIAARNQAAPFGRVEVSVRNDEDPPAPIRPESIELVPSGGGAAIPMDEQSLGEYRSDLAPGDYTLNVRNGLESSSVSLPVRVDLGVVSTDTATLTRLVKVQVTLNPTPPVGTIARLQNDDQLFFPASTTAPEGTTTLSTFYVPRNDNYRIVVDGGGYPQRFEPNDNSYFRVRGSDTLVTKSVAIPRIVDVVVGNATSDTEVQLTNVNGTPFSPDLVDTAAPFRFELDSTTGTAPGVGALSAVVTDPARRTEVVSIPDLFVSAASVNLRPLITVSGQLTTSDGVVVPDGTTIEAVETDATFTELTTPERRPGTVGANNRYTITGFDHNAGGPSNGVRYFQVQFTLDGVGTGTANVTIDQSSPDTVTANMVVTARTRSITVLVVDVADAAIDGATVTLTAADPAVFTTSAGTPTTGADAGKAVFTGIRETLALTVSVDPPAGSTTLGTASDSVAAGPADVAELKITLPALPPPPPPPTTVPPTTTAPP